MLSDVTAFLAISVMFFMSFDRLRQASKASKNGDASMFPFVDAKPCDVCKGISVSKLASKNGYPHHLSLDDLLNAADGGCKLCHLIRDAIMRVGSGNKTREPFTSAEIKAWADGSAVNDRIVLYWRKDIGFPQDSFLLRQYQNPTISVSEQICITWSYTNDKKETHAPATDAELRNNLRLAKLTLYVDEGTLSSRMYPGRTIPANFLSRNDQLAMVKWLDRCIAESNGAYRTPMALPSRVIDVGNSLESDTAKLICTSMQPHVVSTRYIILSHCWGGRVPGESTTTIPTLAARRSCISVQTLAANFRDAIDLTRLLKIRYLWIDALCILQDSKEDWQTESAKMGAYYQNSWLTIAVAMGPDSNSGLFGDRKPPMEPLVRLESGTVTQGKPDGLYFAFDPIELPTRSLLLWLRGPNNPHTDDPNRTILEAWDPQDKYLSQKRKHVRSLMTKLGTRAWCWQEDLLSPRLVSFDPTQIYFRCDQFVEFETGRRQLPDNDSYLTKGRDTYQKGEWFRMMEDYSTRDLTKETDKLTAVSGLAHEYAKLHPDEYVAGLWKSQLMEGLLWSRHPLMLPEEMERLTRPGEYCAPSWSWASVKGPVMWSWSEQVYQAEILDVSVRHAGKDTMGEVTFGELLVRGPVHRIDLPKSAVLSAQHGTIFNMDVKNEEWSGTKQDVIILMVTREEGLLLELVTQVPQGPYGDVPIFKRIGKYQGYKDSAVVVLSDFVRKTLTLIIR